MNSHSRVLKRSVLVLGTCVCVLASVMAYIIWADGKARSETPTGTMEATNILIQREGFDDIQLARTGGRWQLKSPCSMAANEQRLSPLISALTPGAFQYTSSEVDLEAAGLLAPKAIITIDTIEHRIGNTDLKGNRRYLQRNDVVELIPEWVLSLVNGGVSALAQLEIFTAPLENLTMIDSAGTSREITLADELAVWQTLGAQQIVQWPLSDMAIASAYQVQTVDSSGIERTYTVYRNDSLTAIKLDDALCAYILPADALPY